MIGRPLGLAAIVGSLALCQAPVAVTSDERETTYSAAEGGCRIHWIAGRAEPNRGVVRHRAECGLPLTAQMPLLGRILGRALKDGPFHTLFWGRLYPDGSPDPTLSMRLVLAAHRSRLWDATRGRPRDGNLNTFVRNLANRGAIYAELRDVFRAAGLEIEASAVEKVLVLPAVRLPLFDRLPRGEVAPSERLPYDCMIWFSVAPPAAPSIF